VESQVPEWDIFDDVALGDCFRGDGESADAGFGTGDSSFRGVSELRGDGVNEFCADPRREPSSDGSFLPDVLGDSFGEAFGDILGDALGEALGDALGEALGDALGDAIGDILGDALGDARSDCPER
jgi:hypothetical protein